MPGRQGLRAQRQVGGKMSIFPPHALVGFGSRSFRVCLCECVYVCVKNICESEVC